jgi:3-deoxy-manno-octulosonate cytidylyltransferase (CMP-KDO synthetase)
MKICAFIPARYAATRFPGKLVQPLGDKTVIRHVYDASLATGLFDDVIVVTDSDIIFKEITTHGGKAMMSLKEHASGSDRIAEAVEKMDVDVIVNVQGDEPFIKKEPLEKLVALFQDDFVQVASLMRKINNEEAANPNCVKVVTDKNKDALYFSRSAIPYSQDKNAAGLFFLHVGVYAYRKEALLAFTGWLPSPLELTEKLEQLRYLENGMKIRMAETDYYNISIDTPADLAKAGEFLKQKY